MLSTHSDTSPGDATSANAAASPGPVPVKIVVAGGFGVGKTTMVGTVSEIPPLTTEAAMTTVAAGIDNVGEVTTKTTTTVAMDFGRITVDASLRLYLFGTPGQDRFGFMWNELCKGALGAIVLVDSRRLEDSFPAIDYFESKDLPFVVAVNQFDSRLAHDLGAVRAALDVDPDVPVISTDARSREAVKTTMLQLLDIVLRRAEARAGAR
ncbi:MAG: GTP-binding protein [Angustibacter sp.]